MILVISIILSSFVYLNAQKPYTGSVESITVGMNPGEFQSLIYIANNQQYFMNNGLKITIKPYSSGAAALGGMLKGESDISIASEFVFANNILQNASVYTVGSISNYIIQYLVARTDRGINNIADLKGKTIGVALGTNEQFFLGRFLELNGIDLSQVTLLNIGVPDAPAALANGTVDAVITFQPYINHIQSLLGNTTVMWSAQAEQPGYNEAICNQSWALAHPDLIVRFLKALVQAENFNVNHKNQAMMIVEKALNDTDPYLQSIWSNYQFTVTLDESQIVAMHDEAQWLINNNLTSATSIPNFSSYVYVGGLKSVDSGAVNIIG